MLKPEKISYKGADHDPAISSKEFGVTRSNRGLKILTGFVLSANIINAGAHLVDDTTIDKVWDALKPVGPYVATETDWEDFYTEHPLIPTQSTDALALSSDLGGLIATSGFDIFVNRDQLESQLESNQLATISVEWDGDDGKVGGAMTVYSPRFDTSTITHDNHDQLINKYALFALQGAGNTEAFSVSALPDAYIPVPRNGVDIQSDDAFDIRITTYEVGSDGAVSIANEQTAEATPIKNVDCDSDLTITSEVALNKSQHDVICDLLDEYSTLIKADDQIVLDSVESDLYSRDSVRISTQIVMLTYPYISDYEVTPIRIKMVALHEILHRSYADLEGDTELMNRIDDAYRSVFRSSDFQMPDEHAQFIGLTPSIPEVEKVWGAITESTYEGDDIGHPWDNATEMISSAASVLAFHPYKFIDNYDTLNDVQKAAIRQVVVEVREIIERYDSSVEDIIPEYNKVAEHLGI